MVLDSESTVKMNYFPDKIVMHKDFCYFKIDKEKKREILAKNRKQAYNGYMSDATKRNVKKILTTWQEMITTVRESKSDKLSYANRKLIFITLTLSADQKHDDKFIKRHMLDRFIIDMQRKTNVRYYFWKAEKQLNGRIHFHIIVDNYISKEMISLSWNHIQRCNGYTQEYEQRFKRKEPPSTHVEELTNGNESINYVIKYMSKADDSNESSKLKISGRIWGCSSELKALKPYSSGENSKVIEQLQVLEKSDKVKKIEDDFYIIYILNVNWFFSNYSKSELFRYDSYYKDLYRKYYLDVLNSEQSIIKPRKFENITKPVPKQLNFIDLFPQSEFTDDSIHFH